MAKQSEPAWLVLDGYEDEPAAFGVPPYVGFHIRYLCGVLEKCNIAYEYLTIDQWRNLVRTHGEEWARSRLASSEGLDEIAAAQEVVQGRGVSGIPTLCLGGKYVLPSGAVGSATIIDAFRAIEGQGGATGSLFADALGIPDHVMKQTLNLG